MNDKAPNFPDLTDEEVEALVEAIRAASDEYEKMDAMEPYVSWGERRQLLWELTRTGALPTWEEPALWSELANGLAWASSDDVVAFLRNIESYDSGCHESFRLVDFWPAALDELAVRAYANDPEPFDEHWEEFPERVRKGFELVLRRFGELEVDELSTDVVDALARQHVAEGLPMRALMVRDGEPEEVELHDHAGPKPGLYEFIDQFGDRERWGERVLEYTVASDRGAPFRRSHDAWRVCGLEQLGELFASGDIPPEARPELYRILLEERDDDPEELVDLAENLSGEGYSGIEAEMCVVAAILKWRRRGEPVPENVEELLSFRSIGRPTRLQDYHGLRRLVEAVEHLPEERAVARMHELFDQRFSRLDPFSVLQAVSHDEELMERAFEVAEEVSKSEGADFGSMHPVSYGLALAGTPIIEDVEEAFDQADHPLLRDAYRRAIVHMLAERVKRGQGIPEKWNRFISFVDWESPETDDYNFGHFILDDLTAIVANLPEERVEDLLEPQLRSESEQWPRALEALRHHPTDRLLQMAFERLHTEGVPSTGGGFDWLERFLQSMPEGGHGELGSTLAESSAPDLHNTVRRVFGEESYEDFLEEHGGRSSADATPAETLERLAETARERDAELEWTTIYLLEPGEASPAADDRNRIRGAPIGVGEEEWPHREREETLPMEHVVTLDVSEIPELRDELADETEAVALFVCRPDFNEAWNPHNDDTEVVSLEASDLERGEYEGELPAGDRETGTTFEVVPVEVPAEVFLDPYERDPGERDPVVEKIRQEVYQAPGRAGGEPIWVQEEQYPDGEFLFQFDEQFADINLGDMGVMYVYRETAFWQCH